MPDREPREMIVQSALIVMMDAKFRSNQILAGQSIAEIVGQNED